MMSGAPDTSQRRVRGRAVRASQALAMLAGIAALAACTDRVSVVGSGRGAGDGVVALGEARFFVDPAREAGAPSALRVRRDGEPLHYSEGLLARRAAEVHCGREIRGTIRDRFDPPGTWVLMAGCA